MLLVPRRVIKVHSDDQANAQKEEPVYLEELREQAAWVLLGEPGAGKSKAFEMEAQETKGVFISIAEFVANDDPDPAWRGKTLYLDGLDETRASGGDSPVLYKIKVCLRKLGRPRFRIACRAADWFGSTDSQKIAGISQNNQLGVYDLIPLNDGEIQEILRQNHGIPNPEEFVEEAHERGIKGLLDNPQTLGLLAEAIRDGQWPETRLETFELACRKLANEDNEEHRCLASAKGNPVQVEKILTAAGQLCAVLLLSDKLGIALDQKSANEQFPLVDDFVPDDLGTARLATRRKLFRLASNAQGRVVPSHRSIAEFLAADWLARRINEGLPLGRVLNLLLGLDDRTVAGLRGLYGWLALRCQSARQRLIEADPLAVVAYGDAKLMSPDDKRRLLDGLQREIEAQPYYHWEIPSASQFGALADKELTDDFAATLRTTERDDTSQSKVDCVLDVLSEGEPIPGLESEIKAVILDNTRWPAIRVYALKIWLKYSPPASEAIALLDAFYFKQENTEVNDELVGRLLTVLYPKEIPAEKLLCYLHTSKGVNANYVYYQMFWGNSFLERVPESHLPILLDQLVERTDLGMGSEEELSFYLCRMFGALISRGLQVHGDTINDERLYAWLGIGTNKYGEIRRENEHLTAIANWLTARPNRYKAVLALCYKHCKALDIIDVCLFKQKNRLHCASSPSDIGLWHLEQITHDELGKRHFYAAKNILPDQQIEAWVEANPKYSHWLDSARVFENSLWHQGEQLRQEETKRELKRAEQKRDRTKKIFEHLEAIRNGTAWSSIMDELTGVWPNKFENHYDKAHELKEAAESGFFLCPERDDLPGVAEIINIRIEQRHFFICRPCLVGMELRWRQHGESFVDRLNEKQLRCMVAFRLAYGVSHEPAWFLHLVQTRPTLVAEVFIAYASATFKAKQGDIPHFLYVLVHDNAPRALADLVLIPLLTNFPVRIGSTLLPYLKGLLKAALRYLPEQLKELVKQKLSKRIDVPQMVYWLTAGMLLDPEQYESVLWQYIDKKWVRANHLRAFVSDRGIGLSDDYELSAVTLGRLIELLTPHAELEHRTGVVINVTEPMEIGKSVRAMITRLGALASPEAAEEIGRLLDNPALSKLKDALKDARHQLRLKQRENAFCFLSLKEVADVFSNREPVRVGDLAKLTLDFLDQINQELHDKYDGYRAFWNVEKKKPTSRRDEDLCRDELLRLLVKRLDRFNIDCQREGYYANSNRADLRLSYHNEFALPIEIKCDDHPELWIALRTQLMAKYASATEASGYGIYLVLWFGKGGLPPTRDGKKKPVSPEKLRDRLEEQLDQEERQRIFVRVLDVSWPDSK